MNLNPYQLIQIILVTSGNINVGRTAIQKLIYLANEKCGYGIAGYGPHYYGPYNSNILKNLMELIACDFVYEKVVPSGAYLAYAYSITDTGRAAIKTLSKNSPALYNEAVSIIETCKKECDLKTSPLSFAAKVHFLSKESNKSKISHDELKHNAKNFGWDITKDDIDRGTKILKKLELITVGN